MRKLLYLLPLVILFVSCKEKDLTGENDPLAKENVGIAASFIYGEKGLRADSLITNSLGYQFYLTDVIFVLSDFYFYDNLIQDTVALLEEPFVIDNKQPDRTLMIFEPGGYTGNYGLRFGLDSLASVNLKKNLPNDSELKGAGVIRDDNLGVDHIVIKGRLLDPQDPEDTIGKIPLEYRLGTYITSRTEASDQKNFSLTRDSKVKFIMVVDLKPVFDEFDLAKYPTISTDVNDLVELNLAGIMADSLFVGLY